MLALGAVVLAYLVGSLSFAVIVSRLMGMADPRSYGSGNPGATNVLRSGRKGAALATLVLDALKGWLPTALAVAFASQLGWSEWVPALVALAAVCGHLWPLWFGFKGGKGVATIAGALVGLNPWLGLIALAAWLAVAVVTRYSSLAALVAAVVAPLGQLLIWGGSPTAVAVGVMSLLLIWRHMGNIGKLMAGTESRIGGGKAAPAADPHHPQASHPKPHSHGKDKHGHHHPH
ncbi:MAG: glycerol-3-phosphate 1-O-acyltransferase PlsY [Proteobacteria bacterium]|nr:glycerol-3-phosphate 1-O-acyltransferase PlsY [Pseudomonadota bacterium]